MGVDPSKSASDKAKNIGLQIIDDFFNVQTAKKILNKFGKVDLIVSANAICHIPDLNDLISAIEKFNKTEFRNPFDKTIVYVTRMLGVGKKSSKNKSKNQSLKSIDKTKQNNNKITIITFCFVNNYFMVSRSK